MEQGLIKCDSSHTPTLLEGRIYQLADAFLAAQDVAQSSRLTYRRALKAFFVWLATRAERWNMDKVSRLDILAYKDEFSRTKRVATAKMYIFIVKRFFAWLEQHGIQPDITKDIKSFRRTAGHAKDCLAAEQVRLILRGVNRKTTLGSRNYAIINLMVRTGLREIEIARLNIGDVRKHAGQDVLWVHGKGKGEKDAFVVLVPEAMEPITAWMERWGVLAPENPLFPSLSANSRGQRLTSRSVSKIVKDAMLHVGIDSDRLTPHSLRHTAISLAIAGGATLAQAQAMAQHSSPNTTMIYFHNINRVQDAAEKCVNF